MRRRKNSGLFKPAKHKWIADVVTYESVTKARQAARRLVTYLRQGHRGSMKIGQKRALAIVRALNYAANRADAAAKNPKLRPAEKKKLIQIAEVYRRAYDEAAAIYKRRYG